MADDNVTKMPKPNTKGAAQASTKTHPPGVKTTNNKPEKGIVEEIKATAKEALGKYRCMDNLKKGEPYFVLRGQDLLAAELVRKWAARAEGTGCNMDKVNEARAIANAMEDWPNRKDPD